MKILAYVLGALAIGAMAVTVAINVHTSTPDNSKVIEMQKRDIDAMRERISSSKGQMQQSPQQWGRQGPKE
jgi:hypothetical protein